MPAEEKPFYSASIRNLSALSERSVATNQPEFREASYKVMSRVIIFLLVVTAFALSSLGCKKAKTKCPLTVQQAPAIHGIRLGMTPAELNAVLPESSLSDSSGGRFANTKIKVEGDSHPELKGIKEIEISFFEGTIDGVNVTYEDSGEWSSPEEFRAKMYDSLNLPYEDDFMGPNDTGSRMMWCKDFYVSVGMLQLGRMNIPRIYMHDKRRGR